MDGQRGGLPIGIQRIIPEQQSLLLLKNGPGSYDIRRPFYHIL